MIASSDESPVSSLAIGLSVEEIPKVSEWLEELAETHDWPPSLQFGLVLSVEEALANVISYGFKEAVHAPMIRVEYLPLPEQRVEIRIVDNGTPFDPTQVQTADVATSLDEARIGGHGVRLMRHFLEQITYHRVAGENRLVLIAAPKAEASPAED